MPILPLRRPNIRPDIIHHIVTLSPQMRALLDQVRRVARTEASVLIRGETGTGKELVARMLHELSPRASAPFQALNCATLTPEMLGSELFGHVRGAFTGAVRDRPGLFSLAHKGTLFLDEIAELPLELQARLLRVLQERSFVPVGGSEPVSVDIRLLSATHSSLRQRVEERRFRDDLMYRIRVVPLFIPRLAEREGDVEALTWHFIDALNQAGLRYIDQIAPDAMQALLEYDWPGNVRELRNVLEYAFAIGEGTCLMLEDLTPELRGEAPVSNGASSAAVSERERIAEALHASGGRREEAAALLGISRSKLWRLMRELKLQDDRTKF